MRAQRSLAISFFVLFGTIGTRAQSPHVLTPREIFYSEVSPPATSPTDSGANKTKSAAPTPPKKIDGQNNGAQVSAANTTSTQRQPPRRGKSLTQPVSVSNRLLGIRLSLLRVGENGEPREVDTDSVFRAGDKVRLNIRVTENGYLYIIDRGSSGIWKPLFPSPEFPNTTNEVRPGVDYAIPPRLSIIVADPPGDEKLFVILSRTKVDLDALTLEMSQPKGSVRPRVEQPANSTLAMNMPIDDATVDRMRNVYKRDLMIETVDAQTPGDRKERAIYAISTASLGEPRVVLDFEIRHH